MKEEKHFLKRNWHWVSPLFSLVVDLVLLNISFLIAIYLRADNLAPFKDYTKPLVFFNVMFFVFGLGLGVYRSRYNLSLKELRFLYKRLAIYLALSTMAFLYIIKKGQFYSRAIIIITFVLFYVLLEITHSLLKKSQDNLLEKGKIGLNTLVIGTSKWSYKFSKQINSQFGGFFRILGYIKENESLLTANRLDRDNNKQDGKINSSPIYEKLKDHVTGSITDFPGIAKKYQPDMVFIAADSMDIEKYETVYETCKENNIRLKMVSSQVSNVLTNSRIRDVSGVSLVIEQWRHQYLKFNTFFKRLFDLFFILLLSPIVLPVGLLVALFIKITSPGPVFFKQVRSLYEGGPEFEFYKFRSMYRDADSLKEQLLEENESSGALFKMKKDPRITPFGRFIRKLSIDELPQLINVLKGEMSIVGPRPLPIKDFAQLKNGKTSETDKTINLGWYKKRGDAKPGMTGLWQVSGRSNLSFEDMLYLDLYYVEHQSVFFDLEILFETIPTVIFGRGAY